MYRFVFIAESSNHGCRRDQGDRSRVFGCGLRGCPDCEVREFVQRMREKGQKVQEAIVVHNPETEKEVVDNILTRERRGSF